MRRRKKNKNTGRTKKIALGGILTALAMIFSYIESLIPIPLPVPGVKLGIANIAIISVLYLLGSGQALLVNLLRITLTAVLFGNFNSFLFSMAGGMLSLLVMVILKKSGHFSIVGVSVAGGVFHNVGQITAAVFLKDTMTRMRRKRSRSCCLPTSVFRWNPVPLLKVSIRLHSDFPNMMCV